MPKKGKKEPFEDFVALVHRLRKECPWDREQTHRSLRHALIEEAYEVIEAIDASDMDGLKRELGDVLLNIVLHAAIAEETNAFNMNQIIESITEKMIRRHPHVFGNARAENAHDVLRNWEQIKLSEGRASVLEGVPKKMPALLRALRIQERASKVGFDWKKKREVWKKVEEEIRELAGAERSRDRARIDDEFGDVLFALVNYARFIDVNPEFALKSSVEKFSRRFRGVERELHRQGKKLGSVPLKEMDKIWDARKRLKE